MTSLSGFQDELHTAPGRPEIPHFPLDRVAHGLRWIRWAAGGRGVFHTPPPRQDEWTRGPLDRVTAPQVQLRPRQTASAWPHQLHGTLLRRSRSGAKHPTAEQGQDPSLGRGSDRAHRSPPVLPHYPRTLLQLVTCRTRARGHRERTNPFRYSPNFRVHRDGRSEQATPWGYFPWDRQAVAKMPVSQDERTSIPLTVDFGRKEHSPVPLRLN